MRGDPVRLAQMVGNLLHNAAKYTGEGGKIVLAARSARATVRRSWCATPASASHRKPCRTSSSCSRRFRASAFRPRGGLGIGLALVRALVELHGGEIRVASAGVDQGSEFTVRLPLLGASEQPSESAPQRRNPRPPLPVRRNILIADDNQDALESLALMLRMEGHEVHCASDGEEALLLAGQRRPEIVVLDVGMPKLDGCEVARRIRAESWGRGAVLVALTGWGQEVDRRRSREAGFDMHLVKPVDPATLCDMLVAQ